MLFVRQVAVNYKVAVAVIQAMRVVILSWIDSGLRCWGHYLGHLIAAASV